jgi:hypothetical protein
MPSAAAGVEGAVYSEQPGCSRAPKDRSDVAMRTESTEDREQP